MIPGIHVIVHTSATNDQDARMLLSSVGIPFFGKLINWSFFQHCTSQWITPPPADLALPDRLQLQRASRVGQLNVPRVCGSCNDVAYHTLLVAGTCMGQAAHWRVRRESASHEVPRRSQTASPPP